MDPSDADHAGLSGRAGRADLRVSDGERDLAAATLGEHFQAGRLDLAEFEERVTSALRARTRGELAGLLADLPAGQEPSRSPGPAGPGSPGPGSPGHTRPGPIRPGPIRPGPRRPGAGYRLPPLLIALLVAAFIAAGFAAHGGPHRWAGPWPLLWLWWVIPIVAFRMRRGWRRYGGSPSGSGQYGSGRGGSGRGPWR